MIEFLHTYKTYDGRTHALRDVNLKIAKGEFVFLTGPSGAGKTTLFRLLSAFDRCTSGRVQIMGQDLNSMTDREIPYFRRKIGVIYQDFRLLNDRTVRENVSLPLIIRGDRPTYIKEKVNRILDDVGLASKSESFPEHLSGGEQQRIAIARALIHQPGILIADEPTGNLDPKLSEEILDLLERVNELGTVVFVATHDHALVKSRKHRCLSLKSGELREAEL